MNSESTPAGGSGTGREEVAPDPRCIPARATAEFLAAGLPAGSSLLEIGCGEGHVARELAGRGFRVTALDSDQEAVARARALGVEALVDRWPAFGGPPVDLVAFTRSLHHMGRLSEAVEAARVRLRPRGLLRVEDFAFDEADEATIDWFVGVLHSPTARALLIGREGEFATDLLGAADPLGAWHEEHGHDLHGFGAMRRAVERRFRVVETSRAPYLYRYLVPVLPESEEAVAFLEDVLREEKRLGETGEIELIGRRMTGLAPPSG